MKARKDDDFHFAINWLESDPGKSAEVTRETNQENVSVDRGTYKEKVI